MALGYSVSDATMSPSIRYTGRVAADPLGTMESEIDILSTAGVATGSQTTTYRWADYSGMSIDPTDDCTFFYTTAYIPTTGSTWSTRIVSFNFPSCGPDFTLTPTPSTASVSAGGTAIFSWPLQRWGTSTVRSTELLRSHDTGRELFSRFNDRTTGHQCQSHGDNDGTIRSPEFIAGSYGFASPLCGMDWSSCSGSDGIWLGAIEMDEAQAGFCPLLFCFVRIGGDSARVGSSGVAMAAAAQATAQLPLALTP